MTDDQIIDEIIVWAFTVHYPGPAPIGGWLRENYNCDDRRLWIIINKIEELKLATLYSRTSGSDMRLTAKGIRGAETGYPIAFHNKLIEESKKPTIHGNQVIYNSGSISGSEINQGSNRREDFPKAQSSRNVPEQKPNPKSLMWDKIPDWAKIIGGLGAMAGFMKVVIELIRK